MKDKTGKVSCKLIEIKPYKQTIQPVISEATKKTRRQLKDIKNWVINTQKWEAAKAYCMERGWEFVILTEKNLFKHEK